MALNPLKSDDVKVLLMSGAILALLGLWWFTSLVPVDFLMSNSLFVASAAVVLLFTWWIVQERDESDSAADTASKVFDRAEDRTNGLVTTTRVAVMSLFGIAATVGTELLALATELLGMGDPLAWANLGTLGLGAIALSGTVQVGLKTFIGVGLLLFAAAIMAGKTPLVD